MIHISVKNFFDQYAPHLPIQWLAGLEGCQRPLVFGGTEYSAYSCTVVNFFNPIRPPQIQIIADQELTYLQQLSSAQLHTFLEHLLQNFPTACWILANQPCPASLRSLAEKYALPLLACSLEGRILVMALQKIITRLNTQRITLHGVFMDVLGTGVLIMGKSGCGKSELALELISRGHRLVADDAPEFFYVEPNDLRGSCPHNLGDFLEVRGLGILNIKKLFGEAAVKSRKYLHLIVRLESELQIESPTERLEGIYRTQTIMGVDIPEIILPVAPGRNLAVLLECAVRNHNLRQQGYHALDDFSARQMRLLQASSQLHADKK